MSEVAGALLFARYAYPPNALGLCGADSPGTLLEYGDAGASDGGLAELARTFEGAWPYLTLIAEANRIEDPLDPRVVEAYWVGNGLLARVPPADARAPRPRALPRPARQRRREDPLDRRRRRGAAPLLPRVRRSTRGSGCSAAGSSTSRSASSTSAGRRRRSCSRSRAESADVLAEPLLWEDGRLRLGEPEPRRVRWRDGGRAFVPAAAGGAGLAPLGLRLRRPHGRGRRPGSRE